MSSNRVFVGGLNELITDDDLRQFFRRCPRIKEVFRRVDYAFVDFEDVNGAEIAIRELHNTVLRGCTVSITPALYNRGAEVDVTSNYDKRAVSTGPFKSRFVEKPSNPVPLRSFIYSSHSRRNISPLPPRNRTSSKFGSKSPQQTGLAVKLETSSPTRPSTDAATQHVDQILLDGNVIPKPPAENAERIGPSERAKRPKVTSHPKIGETRDTRRATNTVVNPSRFEIKGCFSDCALVVEEKVLHANKSLLSIYSAKLHSLFTSTKSSEITLSEDIGLEEFLVLLDFIYPSSKQVTAANLECLLSVANKLEVSSVIAQCELYMSNEAACTLTLTKKIYLAQLYGLHSLQANCINQCNSIEKLKLLKTEEEYELLDGNTMRLLIENATAD